MWSPKADKAASPSKGETSDKAAASRKGVTADKAAAAPVAMAPAPAPAPSPVNTGPSASPSAASGRGLDSTLNPQAPLDTQFLRTRPVASAGRNEISDPLRRPACPSEGEGRVKPLGKNGPQTGPRPASGQHNRGPGSPLRGSCLEAPIQNYISQDAPRGSQHPCRQ